MIVIESILAFLLVLGPLVFFHELGHFTVAKLLRIGVPVFSLGFGPRLVGLRRGGTDYRLSLVPLGGYVRLAGDEADEERQGRPEEFLSRPKWQRFLVFVAGATFNVVLAFLALWLVYAVWGKEEVPDPGGFPVVQVVAPGSPAEAAGVLPGDRLLALGGQRLEGLEAFNKAALEEIDLSPATRKPLRVERGGRELLLDLAVPSDPVHGHGVRPGWGLSWGGDQTPVVASVRPGDRAEEAGLRTGDRIVVADGRAGITEAELRALLEASPGRDLPLEVERAGERITITVRPRDEDGKGRIGVGLGVPTVHRDLGLVEAAGESLRENVENSAMLFQVLKRMITRDVPLRSVSGPIGIAQVAREALLASTRHFLWLLAFFSLQLGILNLLPIPVLDGGHVLILLVEGLMRRDLSERLKERVMQVGFVFLLAFMSIVLYLDILKL